MKHYKTILVEKQVPDQIICNCCGKTLEGQHPYLDYLHIQKQWGYDSPYDGETHEMDICPDCYAKWIQTFKIPPQMETELLPEEAEE